MIEDLKEENKLTKQMLDEANSFIEVVKVYNFHKETFCEILLNSLIATWTVLTTPISEKIKHYENSYL